jgi:predicted flap endonuclease-1-like 5' DNA nuclease
MTQVFALERPYGPSPDDERAHLLEATILYRGFDPDVTHRHLWFRPLPHEDQERSQRLTELARQGLMNRRDVLPYEVRDMMWAKWENPMLGIYGAHLMLLDREPGYGVPRVEHEEDPIDWGLYCTVVHNLRRLLGRHPDVEALALQHEDLADYDYRFEVPPMLRQSWALIQQATFHRPELVPAGSLASQTSDRLWGGSLWHLWQAPAESALLPFLARAARAELDEAAAELPVLDDYDLAIANQLRMMKEPDSQTVWEPELEGRMMHDLSEAQLELDDDQIWLLMESMGLPRAKVEERVDSLHEKAQLYQSLRSEMPPVPERTWILDNVVAQVRQTVRKGDTAPDVGGFAAEGSDGSRITALAILQARPDPQYFPFVRGAIEASRSAFEQFNALAAARAMLSHLDSDQRKELYYTLQDQRSGGRDKYILPGTDRWLLSERILEEMGEGEPPALMERRPGLLGDPSSSLRAIEGVGDVYAGVLRLAGIGTASALLEQCSTPRRRKKLAEQTGISSKLLLKWVDQADLFRIKGVGHEYYDLLGEAGVDTLPELAESSPGSLYARLVEVNRSKALVRRLPSLGQVGGWIEQAKTLPRI